MSISKRITPFLWFDNTAEDAMNFYLSIFANSKAIDVLRGPQGVITCSFELDGQRFIALNAGPVFKFNEAISFFVECANQEEVDYYYSRLLANGGKESQCGWLKDRFGVSWQVIPSELALLLYNTDPVKAQRATQAMMSMKKLDIAALKRASESV
jgi:predicted 3-demethylubiquinone-9 3-methyltransferase (glyoxalase superfamily)